MILEAHPGFILHEFHNRNFLYCLLLADNELNHRLISLLGGLVSACHAGYIAVSIIHLARWFDAEIFL